MRNLHGEHLQLLPHLQLLRPLSAAHGGHLQQSAPGREHRPETHLREQKCISHPQLRRLCNPVPAQGQPGAASGSNRKRSTRLMRKTPAPEINPRERAANYLPSTRCASSPGSHVPGGYRHRKGFSVARAPWLDRRLRASRAAQAPLPWSFWALYSDLRFPSFTRIPGDPGNVIRLQHPRPQQ